MNGRRIRALAVNALLLSSLWADPLAGSPAPAALAQCIYPPLATSSADGQPALSATPQTASTTRSPRVTPVAGGSHAPITTAGGSLWRGGIIHTPMSVLDSPLSGGGSMSSAPVITVDTRRNALGGWVTVTGTYFSPSTTVELFADGLNGRSQPFAVGVVGTDSTGQFTYTFQADCWPGQDDSATIRAVDDKTRATATGSTYAYWC